jgi:predicted phage tail protein
MTQENSRWSNLLVAFVPLLIGAQAIHWLTTPTSASASGVRWWAVVTQAVLGVGVGCWFLLRARSVGHDR